MKDKMPSNSFIKKTGVWRLAGNEYGTGEERTCLESGSYYVNSGTS
ncbi:hypothetical protein ACFLTK_03970 [Chloroflexota bacterium]